MYFGPTLRSKLSNLSENKFAENFSLHSKKYYIVKANLNKNFFGFSSVLNYKKGFAAGIMTAATFWSLLLPALEIAEHMNNGNKIFSLIPILIGIFSGAGFVHIADTLLPDDVTKHFNFINFFAKIKILKF